MTRQELWEAMINHTEVTLVHIEKTAGSTGTYILARSTGTISDIGMEDGSGYSFIVKLNMPDGVQKTIYVRCPKPTMTHNN